jgi:MFS family permease
MNAEAGTSTIAPAPEEAAADLTTPGPRRQLLGWYAIFVLVVASIFASLDRSAIPLQADRIRASLGLSDVQLGLLQDTGIAIFTASAAYPIAWLADRYDRWSAAIAACALANSFLQIFVASAMLGAGGAGLTPISMATVAAFFSGRQRYLANSVYIFAIGVGGALAASGGGLLIETIQRHPAGLQSIFGRREPWRLVFLSVALSAPLLIALIASLSKDKRYSTVAPKRAVAIEAGPRISVLGFLAPRRWIFARIYLAFSLFILGQAAIGTWIYVILSRSFGQSPAQIGAGVGLSSLLASLIGLVLSAACARWLAPRVGVALPLRLLGVAGLAVGTAAACMSLATTALHIYVLFFISNIAIVTAGMSSPGVIQNIGLAPIMTRLFAILSICSTAFAAVAGPLVGALSDHMKTLPHGLLLSVVMVAAPAFLACGLVFLSSTRSRRGGAVTPPAPHVRFRALWRPHPPARQDS